MSAPRSPVGALINLAAGNGFAVSRIDLKSRSAWPPGRSEAIERMWNPWFALSMRNACLVWEAQGVMALRLMRLGLGGAKAQSEATRMVSEKFAALGEAQAVIAAGAIRGQSGHRVANKVVSVYRKRVRGNRRRLAKKRS
ncbi:MAG TPA: hypothetical protein VHC73_09660 [Vitreimonas sp.]|nr:hypothetical protein [Vitreimonas sp.]